MTMISTPSVLCCVCPTQEIFLLCVQVQEGRTVGNHKLMLLTYLPLPLNYNSCAWSVLHARCGRLNSKMLPKISASCHIHLTQSLSSEFKWDQ